MRRRRHSYRTSTDSAVAADIDQNHPSGEHTFEQDDESSTTVVKWRAAYVLAPVALALISSINTLWNTYASDDYTQVLNSTFIKNLSNLPRAFTTSVWAFAANDIVFTVDSYYRPIFNVLLTINYALFGTTAWRWHLVSVLIHAAAAGLVFMVFVEVTEHRWLSAVAAGLFAVHPVHAESVAWISGITDPLMSLFLLPAFYFYVRYRKTGSWYLMAIGLVFWLAALLSKETALALPLLVIYYEIFYLKSSDSLKRRSLRALVITGLFVLPALLYFILRYTVLAGQLFGTGPRYPFALALYTVPLAIIKYLRLMFVPWGYSYQHYTPLVKDIIDVRLLLPAALITAIVVCIVLARSRILGFAAAWFIIMLAPALAAIRHFEPEYLLQERYLYVPSMGICLAIALGLDRLAASKWLSGWGRVAATSLTLLIILVWGAVYMRANRVWYDTLSVFKNCVAVEPLSPQSHSSLSVTYFNLGRPREAEAEALRAQDVDPKSAAGYFMLSYFAHASGKLDKSIDYLERATSAVELEPASRYTLATIYLNLGMLYQERKDFDKAEASIVKSIDIWPRAVGWYNAGEFYFGQARFEEARVMFEKVLGAAPSWYAPVHRSLGLTYEGLKDTSKAVSEFETYLALAPPDAPDRNDVRHHIDQLQGTRPAKAN